MNPKKIVIGTAALTANPIFSSDCRPGRFVDRVGFGPWCDSACYRRTLVGVRHVHARVEPDVSKATIAAGARFPWLSRTD